MSPANTNGHRFFRNHATNSIYHGHVCHAFSFQGTQAVVVEPMEISRASTDPQPWVWRIEFFDAFPEFDLAMLDRGWWLCYIDLKNSYGSPSSMLLMDAFYGMLVMEHGLSDKPLLEGLSRGGLSAYRWAARNPHRVGLLYADNPVCDIRSWPGGKGCGPGSPQDWGRLCQCYGFPSEAEAMAWRENPLDLVEILARNNVPLVHVFGDADEVVPWQENTGALVAIAKSHGGTVDLFRKINSRHHPHGPSDVGLFVNHILSRVMS